MNFDKYKTIFFDCDGVILNSNKIKTEAFRFAVESYGSKKSDKFISYHCENGGVSRYKKFNYFFDEILERKPYEGEIQKVLHIYTNYLDEKLKECEIAKGLCLLRKQKINSDWMVVSGGDQVELRSLFHHRGISNLFNLGIYGSPKDKSEIVRNKIVNQELKFPMLFVGDSQLDYEVSKQYNMDFLFLYEWTEFSNWKDYFKDKNVFVLKNLSEII